MAKSRKAFLSKEAKEKVKKSNLTKSEKVYSVTISKSKDFYTVNFNRPSSEHPNSANIRQESINCCKSSGRDLKETVQNVVNQLDANYTQKAINEFLSEMQVKDKKELVEVLSK